MTDLSHAGAPVLWPGGASVASFAATERQLAAVASRRPTAAAKTCGKFLSTELPSSLWQEKVVVPLFDTAIWYGEAQHLFGDNSEKL